MARNKSGWARVIRSLRARRDLRRRADERAWEQLREEIYRKLGDPQHRRRPFEMLDGVMLDAFAQTGALTIEELRRSPIAVKWQIPSAAVAEWMESARKRGLIARRSNMRDVWDRELHAPEWELSSDGRNRNARYGKMRALLTFGKAVRVLLPVLSAAIAIAKALGAELPSWPNLSLSLFVAVSALAIIAVIIDFALRDRMRRLQMGVAVRLIQERQTGPYPRDGSIQAGSTATSGDGRDETTDVRAPS